MNKLNLKIGEKITILKPNSLVPELYKGTLKGYYYSNYAQYETALYIYIQRPRAKRVDKIIIMPTDTLMIFEGTFKEMHRKEVIKDTETITHTLLHRWKLEDLKDNKQLIYIHEYNEQFEVNNNIESFIEDTGDFICHNNIKPIHATQSFIYIDYIKSIITNYNVNNLMKHIKEEGYSILENCLNQATEYNW